MHRPTLILRRFGAVSFGLGYYEEGEWVDHTALPDRGRELDIAGVVRRADRVAVHELLHCCGAEGSVVAGRLEAVLMAADGRTPAHVGFPPGDSNVDAVARHSSAR
jgi:hypothetical protein